MPSTCVVGLQWGDEAKGKIVDLLCDQHDVVVRYQGGANAGHTVVVDGVTYKLSLIPTGILRTGIDCVIGNGVVVHPPALLGEISRLKDQGVDFNGRLHLSDRAPRHPAVPHRGGAADRGVGLDGRPPRHHPARHRPLLPRQGRAGSTGYGSATCTIPIDFGTIWSGSSPTRTVCSGRCCPTSEPFDANQVADEYLGHAEAPAALRHRHVSPGFTADRPGSQAAVRGGPGLAAGRRSRQLSLRDQLQLQRGGHPAGSGVPTRHIDRWIGIVKAYTTRVGGGPFPTEQDNETGERIRQAGREFGTVTGRPRRCGWFDCGGRPPFRPGQRLHRDRRDAARRPLRASTRCTSRSPTRTSTAAGSPISRATSTTWRAAGPVYEALPGWIA